MLETVLIPGRSLYDHSSSSLEQIYSIQMRPSLEACVQWLLPSRYPCRTIHNSTSQPTRLKSFKICHALEGKLLQFQLCVWRRPICSFDKWRVDSGRNQHFLWKRKMYPVSVCVSLVAVEKLGQMDGCRKPQTQKRCKAAFGIQTTKEECGLVKETKIKSEPRVWFRRDSAAVGWKSGDWMTEGASQ